MDNDSAAELLGIEAKVVLAEYANVDPGGKANLIGAGWTVRASGDASFYVVVFLQVQNHVNGEHEFRMELVDENGQTPAGIPQVDGNFEISREETAEDSWPVSPIIPLGVQMHLPAHQYLEWRLWIDGQTHSSWKAGFHTI